MEKDIEKMLKSKHEKLEEKIKNKLDDKAEKAVKISKFASKLSELRKERGISQKKAAADLGISQALLSHYEKGIRECGLDFVIRCSQYYGVSTDYMLGVTSSRKGFDLSDITWDGSDELSVSTFGQATKELIDIIISSGDRRFMEYIYDYYVLCVYRGALSMAKTGMLPKEMFKIDFNLGRELCSAAIAVEDAKFAFIEDKSRNGTDLAEYTPLQSLIEKAEDHILNSFFLG